MVSPCFPDAFDHLPRMDWVDVGLVSPFPEVDLDRSQVTREMIEENLQRGRAVLIWKGCSDPGRVHRHA